jgi:hypothetical protein
MSTGEVEINANADSNVGQAILQTASSSLEQSGLHDAIID